MPTYVTPLGTEPEPRLYLVESLSAHEHLDDGADDDALDAGELLAELPSIEEGLAALRRRGPVPGDAANDSDDVLRVMLFVSRSHASTRMLATTRELVDQVGARAHVQVFDIADAAAAPEIARHRVTFTPTLILEMRDARTRIVGAAGLSELASVLPDLDFDFAPSLGASESG